METWQTAVDWWQRPESAHSVALRVAQLLELLAAVDPVLSVWELPPFSNSNSRAMTPFNIDDFEHIELEREGRSRRDDNGAVIEKSGFNATILTPDAPNAAARTRIGLRAGYYGAHMSANSCSIELDEFRYNALRAVDKQCALLHALASVWAPDYGFVSSLDLLVERKEEGRRPPERVPDVGWLTYLPARRGPLPTFKPPAWTVPLGDLGSIIVASPERVSISKPETVAAVDAVQEQLAQAGLLEPEPVRPHIFTAPTRTSAFN